MLGKAVRNLVLCAAIAAFSSAAMADDYTYEPMPPGFQVVISPVEGPVFADAAGRTLYTWPKRGLRGGAVGEDEGKPACYDIKFTENVGFFSPYPGGNELPNVASRPTCVQHWPPVVASEQAVPVGNWSIVERSDGSRQWAYKLYALYTSHLDTKPGETNGGWSLTPKSDHGGPRRVLQPAPSVPAQFDVTTKALGRLLTTSKGYSVYSYEKDTPSRSNCIGACLDDWEPILAPDAASASGDWSKLVRPGGQNQWVFRGKPLYRYLQDTNPGSYDGGDVAGWKNVFVQAGPRPPEGFQIVDTNGGQVLADPTGKPIYYYDCVEDTLDSLRCDSPDTAQEYRWAMCGGGDAARCLAQFPYVLADKNARSDNVAWSVRSIDPVSGSYTAADTSGSLRIWAFRGRPVYTFVRDGEPGYVFADAWGQDHGAKNGFNVFWTRDAFWGLD